MITSFYERFTGRLNLESKLRDWLTVGLRSTYSYSDQNFPVQEGTRYSNNIVYIRNMSAIYPLYKRDEDGTFLLDDEGNKQYDFGVNVPGRTVNVDRPVSQPSNQLATTYMNDLQRERTLASINGFIKVDLTKELSFKTTYAVDNYLFDYFDYDNPDNGDGENVGGRVDRRKNITNSWTWYNQLDYSKQISKHTINATIVSEAYNYKYEYMRAQKTSFPFNGLKEFNAGATLEDIAGYTNQTRLASILGRISYGYADRYFIEVAARRDASTRFAKDKRNGNFVSAGASWVVSEEDFLQHLDIINFLKIKTS